MNSIIDEIIEIFNIDKVELVRLSGLFRHLYNIDTHIRPQDIHLIIFKLKERNIIDYKICCYCPHCNEIFYLKTLESKHKCDTCSFEFDINTLNTIKEKDISNLIEVFTKVV